tara:strand:- start:394 stop:1761 length:1368 start_codon:yes stop_codon:yes gene_type:complete
MSKRKRPVAPPTWLTTLLQLPKPTPSPCPAPPAYLGQLRDYQQQALGFANHRTRTMLALDCGLGKTHIGIAYMAMYLPALVVCPASLKTSWEEHILSFAPTIADSITIVSYAKMGPVPPGIRCIVADEAHYLKHEGSQRSKTFVGLLERCDRTLLLTGTPAQRNMDLYHLLKILDPEHFRHFFHYGHTKKPGAFYFAERYSEPQPVWIGGARHGFKFTRNTNVEELGTLCGQYMLRMKKEDVVALPTLHTLAVTIGQADDPLYFKRQLHEIEDIRETQGNRRADVAMMALCRETSQMKMAYLPPYIRDWRRAHPGEKLILFYHHKDIGNQVEALLGEDCRRIRIDGATSMKKRVALLQTFRNDPTCNVGVLSMCATSTGLNLQFCTKIMFIELTFLSVHHTQAEARIHRIGQDREVSVDYMVLEGSTDTMLWRSLVMKRRNECRLFDDDDGIHPL